MVERLIFDGPDIFLADLNMQKKRRSEVAIMQLSFGMKNNSFFGRVSARNKTFFRKIVEKKSVGRCFRRNEGRFFQPSFQFKETSSSYADLFLCLFLRF